MSSSESHLTRLIRFAGHTLLPTSLADLIGTDPLPLDRPGAEALVVRVIASKVAVFYQTATRVPAREVNDFILTVCQRIPEQNVLVLGRKQRTWHMTAALRLIGEFVADEALLRSCR